MSDFIPGMCTLSRKLRFKFPERRESALLRNLEMQKVGF